MNLLELSDEPLLQIGSDFFEEFSAAHQQVAETRFRAMLLQSFEADRLSPVLSQAFGYFAGRCISSWVHREASAGYWCLETLRQQGAVFSRSNLWKELLELALDPQNLLMPYDYRALLLECIADMCEASLLREWLRARLASQVLAPKLRTQLDFALGQGDGIDHLFPIPGDSNSMNALVLSAAMLFGERNVATLEARFRSALGESSNRVEWMAPDSLVNAEVLALVDQDTGAKFIRATDYLMPWSMELAIDRSYSYTLAEVLRIVAMGGMSSTPDTATRSLCVAFYRNALKVSGRSTVGLSAKIFHVEHGSRAEASLFYMGRDVILGKGLMIDVVGGFAALTGSFLGGGYMPIIIHTHKHLRSAAGKASGERKEILPACFVARSNARLPMSYVGLWESADYLNSSSPFAGIESYPLTVLGEIV